VASDPIRVIIADDHPIVRSGLKREIERDPGCVIVGEADNGVSALALMRSLTPDIAIVDLDMPTLDGFGVARAMQAERIETALVFLTMHDQEDMFHAAMQLGARGYILKDTAVTELVQAIKTVTQGMPFVSAPLVKYLLQRRTRADALLAQQPGLESLTTSERRILAMVADGRSSKEIAETLFIHYRTVENHRGNICQKLGLNGPNALLRFALTHKHELP
jgi:DNA-binding NarL/FixJ family response regulator